MGAFFYAELWLCIVCITGIMIAIVVHVARTETKTERYSLQNWSPTLRSSGRISRTVRKQAIQYVLAFYETWVPLTIVRILQAIENATGKSLVPFGLLLVAVLFTPLQGFFNCLIYMRPRFLRQKRMKEQTRKQRIEPNLKEQQEPQPCPECDNISENNVEIISGEGQQRRCRGHRRRSLYYGGSHLKNGSVVDSSRILDTDESVPADIENDGNDVSSREQKQRPVKEIEVVTHQRQQELDQTMITDDGYDADADDEEEVDETIIIDEGIVSSAFSNSDVGPSIIATTV